MQDSQFKIVKSEKLSFPWESRYVVVDPETGAIIDDSQGYGFTTEKAARNAALHRRGKQSEKFQPVRDREHPHSQSNPAASISIERWLAQRPLARAEMEDMKKFAHRYQIVPTMQDVRELLFLAEEPQNPFSKAEWDAYFIGHVARKGEVPNGHQQAGAGHRESRDAGGTSKAQRNLRRVRQNTR